MGTNELGVVVAPNGDGMVPVGVPPVNTLLVASLPSNGNKFARLFDVECGILVATTGGTGPPKISSSASWSDFDGALVTGVTVVGGEKFKPSKSMD